MHMYVVTATMHMFVVTVTMHMYYCGCYYAHVCCDSYYAHVLLLRLHNYTSTICWYHRQQKGARGAEALRN